MPLQRRLLSFVLAALSLVLIATAQSGEEAGLVWTENMKDAMAMASKEQKDLLMNFTGSDWCGWCIRLHKEVFDKAEFSGVSKSFVLVKLDFPRKRKLPEEVKAQNEEWRKRLGVGGYPSIILADAAGRPYAKTGYRAGGPEPYLKHLDELQQVRVQRDEALAKAEKATGLAKAQLLDTALDKIEPALVASSYSKLADEIIQLDAENQAGLKNKYLAQRAMSETRSLTRKRDLPGAIKKATETIEALNASGQVAQDLYLLRSEAHFRNKDKPAARKDLDAALAAAPEGNKVKQIKGIIGRFFTEK